MTTVCLTDTVYCTLRKWILVFYIINIKQMQRLRHSPAFVVSTSYSLNWVNLHPDITWKWCITRNTLPNHYTYIKAKLNNYYVDGNRRSRWKLFCWSNRHRAPWHRCVSFTETGGVRWQSQSLAVALTVGRRECGCNWEETGSFAELRRSRPFWSESATLSAAHPVNTSTVCQLTFQTSSRYVPSIYLVIKNARNFTSTSSKPTVTISHPPSIRLPLLSAKPAVTFPAVEHHRPLAGNKLYCLVTEAHRCEQHAQGFYTAFAPSKIWTHNLLLASSMLYPVRHRATLSLHKSDYRSGL